MICRLRYSIVVTAVLLLCQAAWAESAPGDLIPPVYAAPAGALLTGKTPANFAVPTGWQLVRTQDFESGSIAPDEMAFGSITNDTPHSGTRSLQSRVWKDDCATGWKLNQGVATEGELYLSWYEYMEDHGRMNDEMFLLSIRKNWSSDLFETQRWQWLNDTGDWAKMFNLLEGNLVFFCEGRQPGATGSVCYYENGVWRSVGFGKWQQWEVYWKTNTPGVNDGITQIYLDGVKITELTDSAFSGVLNMLGPAIFLGGPTYTKIIWGPNKKPSTVCAKNTGEFVESIDRPQDFSLPVICPDQAPPNGYVPVFHRFVDDIIILQKETPFVPDAIPPSTPANLSGPAIVAEGAPVVLTWTASTDNRAVTGYQIYRDDYPIGTTPTTSFSDPKDRYEGRTYSYTVIAADAVGNLSPKSAAHSVVIGPRDSTPPTVPTGLSGSATSATSIRLTWTASTDPANGSIPGSGVAGYRIFRDWQMVGTSATTSFVDPGLSASTTYPYYVLAYDEAGNRSAKAGPVNVKTSSSSNQAPVLAPIGNRSTPAGDPLQITVQGTDADGDTLQYSATGG